MKMPAILFYTGDWIKDPAVSLCSPATRGIWVDFLCAMHESNRSGVITGNREQLTRVGRCSTVELDQALSELTISNAAKVTERNGIVTVVNRRMKREAEQRLMTNKRVSKFRGKRFCNTDVLIEDDNEYVNVNKFYRIEDVKDACILNGIPDSNAQSYFDHYNSQDWKKANSQPITNLQSHIAERWDKAKEDWDFAVKKEKSQPKGRLVKSATCVFCHHEGCASYFISPQGQVINTCTPCHQALQRMGIKSFDRPIGELEKLVEKGRQLLNTDLSAKKKLLRDTGSDSMDEYQTKEKVREQISKLGDVLALEQKGKV